MTKIEDINSLESEAGVIATLIHHPEFIYNSESLLPNHFVNIQNRYIYIAIGNLANRGITKIDAYNIMESLSSNEATKKIVEDISIENLQEIISMSDILTRGSVQEYKMLVSNIIDRAFRRAMIVKLRDCEGYCENTNIEDVGKYIYQSIDDIMIGFSTVEDVPEFKDVVDDVWKEIESHQDGHESGIPFKIKALNDFVTLEGQELVVVGAPKKGAKSIFMLNEAIDLLMKDKSVMYIDSEISDRLFLCRMVSHLTGIEFVRVRNGRYNEQEKEKIRQAILWVKSKKFVHLYIPIFERDTIYKAVKQVHHKFGKLDVLIVDYLKATGDVDAYGTYAELGKLTDMIKNDIAGSMDIAAMAATQLTDAGKIADSAKIARNASTILLLLDKTPEEINADGVNCGTKKLIVQLNRNGPQHTYGEYIDVAFNGNIMLVSEAEQHMMVAPY